MNQYFNDNQHLKSNRKEISFRFWCLDYTFIVDHGVFSKGAIDEGSKILLDACGKHDLGNNVLDLGCGYGVIGIVLKKYDATKDITLVDVNPRAVLLAKDNAILNKVDVCIETSNGFEAIQEESFSSIILNPPIRAGKEAIYSLFEQSYQHLNPNGMLLIVMRKSHGALSAKTFLEQRFGNCEIVKKEKGYFVMKSKKA